MAASRAGTFAAQAISASSTASSARAASIAMLFDEACGGVALFTGGGDDIALAERDAGAEQMCLRQEQRHGAARGDVFGLAERVAGGVRIATAPERFGMGEQAARQVIFGVGAAQGG